MFGGWLLFSLLQLSPKNLLYRAGVKNRPVWMWIEAWGLRPGTAEKAGGEQVLTQGRGSCILMQVKDVYEGVRECTFTYGSTGLIEWYVEDGCAAVCRAIKAGLASGSGPLKLDSGRTFSFSWSSPDMHTQYRPALVHKLLRACYVLALFWPWRFSSEHTGKPCSLWRLYHARMCLFIICLAHRTDGPWGQALLWISHTPSGSSKVSSLIAQSVKNLPAVQETGFNSWVRKIPWRRKRQPTPVFLPGWRIPWTEEPGSHGVTRIGHDFVIKPPPRVAVHTDHLLNELMSHWDHLWEVRVWNHSSPSKSVPVDDKNGFPFFFTLFIVAMILFFFYCFLKVLEFSVYGGSKLNFWTTKYGKLKVEPVMVIHCLCEHIIVTTKFSQAENMVLEK